MKFDPDIMRDILLDAETIPAGESCSGFNYEGRDQATVNRHVDILIDEGFLEGVSAKDGQNRPVQFHVTDLTYKGHQFLESARNKTLWNRALETVRSKGGAVTINILVAVLEKIAVQQAGLDS